MGGSADRAHPDARGTADRTAPGSGSPRRRARHRKPGAAAPRRARSRAVGDLAGAGCTPGTRVRLHRLMGLAALTDALAAYLESTLEPTPALVGATYPTANTDLPAV